MSTIRAVLASPGFGGSWYTDLEAIKRGLATADGFHYAGTPITPGFKRIQQPATAVCIQIQLSDGQIAYGDGVGVAYSGRMNRDTLMDPYELTVAVHEIVAPAFEGADLDSFRALAAKLETLQVHTAVKYGLSQALLDAVAKSRQETMAETIAREYGLRLEERKITLNHQVSTSWYEGVDKVILRRGDVIHTGSVRTKKAFDGQLDYVRYLRKRIEQIGDADYRPMVHIDQYGHIGLAYDNDPTKVADYIEEMAAILHPYGLLVEDPINTGEKRSQIPAVGAVRRELERRGSAVRIMTDELCPTFADHRDFAEAHTADLQKIKAPDLGSIHNAIECAIYLREKGVGAYLSGSATGTDRSYQVHTHIAIAVGLSQLMTGPGSSVDEAHSVVINELGRTIALLRHRGVID